MKSFSTELWKKLFYKIELILVLSLKSFKKFSLKIRLMRRGQKLKPTLIKIRKKKNKKEKIIKNK